MKLLYEGKAKFIYETDQPHIIRIVYKDSVTAFNGLKKDEMAGKGRLNNEISALLFEELRKHEIDSHFIRRVSEVEQDVKPVTIIPLEVVVHNVVAGSLAKRLGLAEGDNLEKPFVDFFYKEDKLDDPLVTDDHIKLLGIATQEQLDYLRADALKLNDVLVDLFQKIDIRLVDFKVEYGIDKEGKIILADEISPDTCRLWDITTNEKLDKDVYRREIGDLREVYEVVLERLRKVIK